MSGRPIAGALVAVALVAGACGGDDDTGDGSGEDRAANEDATTTVGPATAPIEVLVTNDDAVGAEGIDVLVEALRAEEGVEVTVVAPAEQQSGTGGTETAGELATAEATTAGGYEATAVDGFPSDTVRVAIDDMGLEPDLVISGINEGQNLGPVVDLSGTVGAARAAVRRGVPALAVSQGLGETPDFEVAADLVLDWLDENRAAVAGGDLPTDEVPSLNVPTCPVGEVRGLVEVGLATEGDIMGTSDCTSTEEGQDDDIEAFLDGFATYSVIPVEPAVPASTVTAAP